MVQVSLGNLNAVVVHHDKKNNLIESLKEDKQSSQED